MIIDVKKFVDEEKPYWDQLDRLIHSGAVSAGQNIESIQELHYLYERACSDLFAIMITASFSLLTEKIASMVQNIPLTLVSHKNLEKASKDVMSQLFTVPIIIIPIIGK